MTGSPITAASTMSDIDVTPLVDLTFLLLIVFIITTPLMEHGLDIKLPKASSDPIPQDQQVLQLEMDAAGTIALDGVEMNDVELEMELRGLMGVDPETPIQIRADENLGYGQVMGLLEVVKKAGVKRLALVTEAPGGEGG
jgi:biopolymer transport protein ExbD